MNEAPDRIWLVACGDDDAGPVWECVSAHVADPSLDVEYVRADLVAALVTLLECDPWIYGHGEWQRLACAALAAIRG